ncbi:MAG: LemA family protein [Novosphingobium sp.]|uniref:LemA family protein n=1 Tax=Novosphingobium sp. TaxID=1874826 RepID=UPI001D49B43D|nr:LemA family protein [Novosphingobium sp.]MCB2058159.1 LemA family protein [Novosphingobium sp.]MCP5386445.1 LemA family protein [Novosphingobium sp.]HNN56430.1 LemA family protein [Novosphingobium sp.]
MSAAFPTRFAQSALVAATAISLAGCGINSVPTAEEQAKAKWADVQAAFQERANLIPNLAAVAKGAAEQEKGILTGVIEARAKATSIQIKADDLSDPAKMKAFQEAQNQLSGSLMGFGRLLANAEAYPELKSITNYQMLQSQLEGQENRIRVAIRDYNEAVRQYNTTIRTFPDAIGAKVIYGAKPMVPYEAATPGAEVAPSLEGKL